MSHIDNSVLYNGETYNSYKTLHTSSTTLNGTYRFYNRVLSPDNKTLTYNVLVETSVVLGIIQTTQPSNGIDVDIEIKGI